MNANALQGYRGGDGGLETEQSDSHSCCLLFAGSVKKMDPKFLSATGPIT
ncbi:hypothetical protein LZK73_13710 [Neorhizobium galegae]|nr:hypothetical protein LZK73_13710 [Neorhizobium galegae]